LLLKSKKPEMKLSLSCVLLCLSVFSYSRSSPDSLHTSLEFNISLGMMWAPEKDAISFLQSYNPNYNLKYKKLELGLGIDYYRYSIRFPDIYSIENIWSFSTFLRRYFFKKEYLYAELFLNTGYWDSRGELKLYTGDQYISTFGIGAGLVIPPLRRFRDHKFLRNLYGHINYRESFIHRDILILKGDVNFGLIYKF
jgi:hypothetical protein